jgi:hypothetical protein
VPVTFIGEQAIKGFNPAALRQALADAGLARKDER